MTGSSEGWFSRLKNGLARTRVNIVGLFSGGVIDDDFLEELEYALITADVGVQASTRILQRLRDTIKLKGLKTQDEVRLALRDEIARMLAPAQRELDIEQAHPLVIMMTGVNGAGKTTSIGKISKYLSQRGKSVLLAAGDTFRAAAREQLAVWGDRNQIEVIAQQGGDPAAVVFDAAVGLTGLIVTKLDGTAKGGVLVAITQMRPENPLPIYFIGVGEAIDDLQPFNAVQFANALVGLDPNTPATAPE